MLYFLVLNINSSKETLSDSPVEIKSPIIYVLWTVYLTLIKMINVSVRGTEITLDNCSRKVNLIEQISYTSGKALVPYSGFFELDWGQLTMTYEKGKLRAILRNCKSKVR